MPADHPGKLAGALRRRLGDGSLAAAMTITLAFVALTIAWQVGSPGIHAQRDSLIWFGRAADVDQQMHTQGVLQAISIASRMHGSSFGFLAVSAVWQHIFGPSPHSLATLQAAVIGLTGFIGYLAARQYLGCGWSALAGLLVFFSSLETMAQARDLLPASHAALGMALLLLGLGQVSRGRIRGTVLTVIGSCFAFLCRPELGAALLLALLAMGAEASLRLARLGRVQGPGAKARAARAQTRLLWGAGITVGAVLAVAAENHAALNDRLDQAGLLGNLSLELWRQRSQVLPGHAQWWTWYLLAPTGIIRNSFPCSPGMSSSGVKAATLVSTLNTTGVATSRAPSTAARAYGLPSSRWAKTFSPTTMASSTTMPRARMKAKRVIMLMVTPSDGTTSMAPRNEIGMPIMTQKASRALSRVPRTRSTSTRPTAPSLSSSRSASP